MISRIAASRNAARPVLMRATASPAAPASHHRVPAALRARRLAPTTTTSSFHTSSRRKDELPKSPFAAFVEVLKEELKKNRELRENVKQLQGDVDRLQDSEAMKKAKEAYERARVCSLSIFFLAVFAAYVNWICARASLLLRSARTQNCERPLRSSGRRV